MNGVTTYLNFDGNTKQAMEFYKDCLGGELYIMSFADAPGDMPKESKDRIMHASLKGAKFLLMASDTMPGRPFQQGNNFAISISPESLQETEKLFALLGRNGKITMPLQDTFWGAHFGMLTDQFGIQWMLNFELPKK